MIGWPIALELGRRAEDNWMKEKAGEGAGGGAKASAEVIERRILASDVNVILFNGPRLFAKRLLKILRPRFS
jgi:hypothetical protein